MSIRPRFHRSAALIRGRTGKLDCDERMDLHRSLLLATLRYSRIFRDSRTLKDRVAGMAQLAAAKQVYNEALHALKKHRASHGC